MASTPDRWQRIEALYRAALERDPASRSAFLHGACGEDGDLRREIESRLAESPTIELKPGSRLGPYQIEALIGQGGMGKVYKARDMRLGRTVAVKTSIARFSERFEREARAVAALNHPHICHLYDVGPDYLVMEYIEGTPLKGPLPVDQALKCAEQVLDALDAAHRKGIVHRDLKPGNILVSKQGIKLLDFGLATMAAGRGDTTMTQMTQTGAVMGTPGYMAPEQWEGTQADARSDIYAFGCVLYEMLTGKRAGVDRMAVAPPLEDILRTCLEKDPDERWQSARELKHALRWVDAGERGRATATPLRSRFGITGWIAAGVFALLAVWAVVHYRQPAAGGRALRLQLDPPPGTRFLIEDSLGGFALSPDGKTAAFVATAAGKNDLWVQPLDGSAAHILAGADNPVYPFWSPDSKSIGFFGDGKLRRIDADGGMLLTVCAVGAPYGGATWTSDGRILFGTPGGGLFQVPASGGVAARLILPDAQRGETSYSWPQFLPDGSVLYFVESDKPEIAGVYAVSLSRPSERVRLLNSDTNAIYASAGNRNWLLWLRGSTLVAQEFDPRALKLAGDPRPLADPVSSLAVPVQRLNVAIPGGGLLLYSASNRLSQFTWMDRTGKPLGVVGEPGSYLDLRLSPDGRRVAVTLGRGDLWLIDSERRVASPLTSGAQNNICPVWSPDGQTIVFNEGSHELMRKPASGVGGSERLLRSLNIPNATDWSRDGHLILYFEIAPDAAGHPTRHLWVLPVTPDGKPVPGAKPMPWAQTRFNEKEARFSPEPTPRWIAYQSDESGRNEVYIDSWPEPRGKTRISTEGGLFPQWRPDGRELFYVSPDARLMSVSLKTETESLVPGEPHELFRLPAADLSVSPYDVARDGQRFLVRASVGQSSEALSMIVNWPALLKK